MSISYQYAPAEGPVGWQMHLVKAIDGDTTVGRLTWGVGPDGKATIGSVQVDHEYRRQGIATEMLRRAREIHPDIQHNKSLTSDGYSWSQHVGSQMTSGDYTITPAVVDGRGVYIVRQHGYIVAQVETIEELAEIVPLESLTEKVASKTAAELGPDGIWRAPKRGRLMWRGFQVNLPPDLEKTIRRLDQPPMEESEIDQHLKIGPLVIDYLARGYDDRSGMVHLGRHWTSNRHIAEIAAMQGAPGKKWRIILEALDEGQESDPDATGQGAFYRDSGSESEVNLKPGTPVTVVGVYVEGIGYKRDLNLLAAPVRKTAVPLRMTAPDSYTVEPAVIDGRACFIVRQRGYLIAQVDTVQELADIVPIDQLSEPRNDVAASKTAAPRQKKVPAKDVHVGDRIREADQPMTVTQVHHMTQGDQVSRVWLRLESAYGDPLEMDYEPAHPFVVYERRQASKTASNRTVRFYHGTSSVLAEAIKQSSTFRPIPPKEISDWVAEQAGIDSQKLWMSGSNAFSRSTREGDSKTYFTTFPAVAKAYAELGSEVLNDCLYGAARIIVGESDGPGLAPANDLTRARDAWVTKFKRDHGIRPVVLTLDISVDWLAQNSYVSEWKNDEGPLRGDALADKMDEVIERRHRSSDTDTWSLDRVPTRFIREIRPVTASKTAAYGQATGGTIYRGIRVPVPAGFLEALAPYEEIEQKAERRSEKAAAVLLAVVSATPRNNHSQGMGIHWTERPEFAASAAATGGQGVWGEMRVIIEATYTADDVVPLGDDLYGLSGVWMDSKNEAEVLIKPGASLNVTGLWVPIDSMGSGYQVLSVDRCPKENWVAGPWANILAHPVRKTAGPAGGRIPKGIKARPPFGSDIYKPRPVFITRTAGEDIEDLEPDERSMVLAAIKRLERGTDRTIEAKRRPPLVGCFSLDVTGAMRVMFFLDTSGRWQVFSILPSHDYEEAERRMRQVATMTRGFGSAEVLVAGSDQPVRMPLVARAHSSERIRPDQSGEWAAAVGAQVDLGAGEWTSSRGTRPGSLRLQHEALCEPGASACRDSERELIAWRDHSGSHQPGEDNLSSRASVRWGGQQRQSSLPDVWAGQDSSVQGATSGKIVTPEHDYDEVERRMRNVAGLNRLNGSGTWDRSGDEPRWVQPHEELLAGALHSWKGWPSTMSLHLHDVEQDAPMPGSGSGKIMRAQAAALAQELATKAKSNPKPLYRGDHQKPNGLTAWSERRAVATRWANKGGGQVWVLPANAARGLRIADYIHSGMDEVEQEWLVADSGAATAWVSKTAQKVASNVASVDPEISGLWRDQEVPGLQVAGANGKRPVDMRIVKVHDGLIQARIPGRSKSDEKNIGYLRWDTYGGRIEMVWVDPKYQRRGIATEMIQVARDWDPTVHHSDDLSDEGQAWSQKVASLTTETYEGTVGDRTHITCNQRGTVPTSAIAHLMGKFGEVPGEHRNKKGRFWEGFKADIAANGIKEPIVITVDPGKEPRISEGNHRRDAAVELGLPEVPVVILYYGHAEQTSKVARFERQQTVEVPVLLSGLKRVIGDWVLPGQGERKRGPGFAGETYFQEIKDDLAKKGRPDGPILVNYSGDDKKWYIEDGNHRAQAAVELGWKTIPAVVSWYESSPPTPKALSQLGIADVATRQVAASKTAAKVASTYTVFVGWGARTPGGSAGLTPDSHGRIVRVEADSDNEAMMLAAQMVNGGTGGNTNPIVTTLPDGMVTSTEILSMEAKVAAKTMRLYHGTTQDRVSSIKATGLIQPPGTVGMWFMLTSSQEQAAWYARREGGVVLAFDVPQERIYGTPAYKNSDVEAWLWPGHAHMNDLHPGALAYAVKGVLPASTLVSVLPAKQAVADDWLPSAGMWTRGQETLDPRIFDGDQMKPEVRSVVLGILDRFWTPRYGGDWRKWAHVYLAGSGASHWWDSDSDLDILIGLDLPALVAARPQNKGLDEAAICEHFNHELKTELDPTTAAYDFGPPKPMEVTYFVNPGSQPITKIHPYAAYSISDNTWVVRPPELPEDWSAKNAPPWMIEHARDVAEMIRHILALPEPQRTIEGTAMFNRLHEWRQEAYSEGNGWLSFGNVVYQWVSQEGLLRPLYLCKHPEEITKAAIWDMRHDIPEAYDGPLYRGVGFVADEAEAAFIMDTSKPVGQRAERAVMLLEDYRKMGRGGLGRHWSTDRQIARHFALMSGTSLVSEARTYEGVAISMLLTILPPDPKHYETDQSVLNQHGVGGGEKEITLQPGATVMLNSVEWWSPTNVSAVHSIMGAPGRGIPKVSSSSRAGIEVEQVRKGRDAVSGVVAQGKGTQLAYRGFGSWGEARDAAKSGRWRSKGMFTVPAEGETQMALSLANVLSGSGMHSLRGTGFLGAIEADVAGLPFRTWVGHNTKEFDLDLKSDGTGLIRPDLGLGIGIDGGIPVDQIKRVYRIENNRVTESWTWSDFLSRLDSLEEVPGWEPELHSDRATQKHWACALPKSRPALVHALIEDQSRTRCGKDSPGFEGKGRVSYRKVMDESVSVSDLRLPGSKTLKPCRTCYPDLSRPWVGPTPAGRGLNW